LGNAGGLKETSTIHWKEPNTGATNATGFTALPGGIRQSNGLFTNTGDYGYWWSSTDYDKTSANDRSMKFYNTGLLRGASLKKSGYSCRCIKD
jgi:uncharacterized protein (TIGR02145 family)